jgi:hypothetical protein
MMMHFRPLPSEEEEEEEVPSVSGPGLVAGRCLLRSALQLRNVNAVLDLGRVPELLWSVPINVARGRARIAFAKALQVLPLATRGRRRRRTHQAPVAGGVRIDAAQVTPPPVSWRKKANKEKAAIKQKKKCQFTIKITVQGHALISFCLFFFLVRRPLLDSTMYLFFA